MSTCVRCASAHPDACMQLNCFCFARRSDASKNEHVAVGKAKIGLRATQLLLYTKTETLAQLALSSGFNFTVRRATRRSAPPRRQRNAQNLDFSPNACCNAARAFRFKTACTVRSTTTSNRIGRCSSKAPKRSKSLPCASRAPNCKRAARQYQSCKTSSLVRSTVILQGFCNRL